MSQSMNGGIRESVGGAAQRVSDSFQHAAGQMQSVAHKTRGGIGEVRDVIRAQPITAALMVFALGYIFGRLGSLIR